MFHNHLVTLITFSRAHPTDNKQSRCHHQRILDALQCAALRDRISEQMNAATAGLLGTALGALASGATALFITHITKRSEERRQLREIAFKTAIQNWDYVCKLSAQCRVPTLPLDVFILHMLKLSEVLTSGDVTEANLVAKLQEVRRFTDIAGDEAERSTNESRKRREASAPSLYGFALIPSASFFQNGAFFRQPA
jgi:hypothetical protein